MDLFQVCSNYAPGAKMVPRQGRQGHGQLSTDTYMKALNKTQVCALGPLGPLVVFACLRCFFGGGICSHQYEICSGQK